MSRWSVDSAADGIIPFTSPWAICSLWLSLPLLLSSSQPLSHTLSVSFSFPPLLCPSSSIVPSLSSFYTQQSGFTCLYCINPNSITATWHANEAGAAGSVATLLYCLGLCHGETQPRSPCVSAWGDGRMERRKRNWIWKCHCCCGGCVCVSVCMWGDSYLWACLCTFEPESIHVWVTAHHKAHSCLNA